MFRWPLVAGSDMAGIVAATSGLNCSGRLGVGDYVWGDIGANAKPATAAAPAAATLEFTVDNVDKTLDEVRPYLISDGGNVKVVSVDPASFGVELQLQGACGSCPSCKYFYACLEEALRTLRCDSPRPGTPLSRVAS